MTQKNPKDSGKALKADLVNLISSDHNLSKKDAEIALDAVTASLSKLISSGKTISLGNLGTFKVVATAERSGVNPSTKEKLTIPAGKKVSFKVAPSLKNNL